MDDRTEVGEGFERLATEARSLLLKAGGGAFCVYVRGRPVLDVWCGIRDPSSGTSWERDSMAMSWSTTKGVTSAVLHMLAERGWLAYDEPVASYWPEFAAHGKDGITVRHVMSMEAGLYDVRGLVDEPADLLDHDVMAARLAAAAPLHEPGAACAYHAFTYGWLAGELVRRVTGASLGDFVAREIATPLDLDGFFIGLPASEVDRVATRPRTKPEPGVVRSAAKAIDPVLRWVGFSPKRFAAAFLPREGHRVIATSGFLTAEVPGANGCFTARSLARFYAALGSDDGLDGVQLWSPETRRTASTRQNHGRDLVVPLRVGWRLGYHRPFPKKHSAPKSFGFYGSYGSGAFADPARDLAVALVVQEAKGLPLAKLLPEILAAVDGPTPASTR